MDLSLSFTCAYIYLDYKFKCSFEKRMSPRSFLSLERLALVEGRKDTIDS